MKDWNVYFDDELEIDEDSIMFYENGDGTKTLELKLKGTQTKYNNVAAKGATVVLTTDITLNTLTPTTNTQITAEITNGDSTVTNVATDVKYIAPSGVVTTNSMTGYNGDEKIEVINGESQKALIPTKAEQKEVTYTMNVINNYENTLDHVVVLGRTPFKDNKDVSTSLSLGSNITMPLASGITVTGVDASKVTIYYSENGEATTDLSNSQNGWTTSVTDYTKIKSYMIVLNEDYAMNGGDTFTFTYKATLPANLDYDQEVYENYGVFFNNNKTSGTITDKAIATKIGLTTGSIAKLDAKLTSTIGEGASVKSGEILEYELTINNTGVVDAENTTVEIKLPPELSFIPQDGDDYTYKVPEDEEYDESRYEELLNFPSQTQTVMQLWRTCAGAVSTPMYWRSAARRAFCTRPASKITRTAYLSGATVRVLRKAAACAAVHSCNSGVIFPEVRRFTRSTYRPALRPTRLRYTRPPLTLCPVRL